MSDQQIRDNIRWSEAEAPFYEAYSRTFTLGEQRYLRGEIRRLSRQGPATLPVLDVGSGTGNLVRHFQGTGVRTLAMDISTTALRRNPASVRVVAESQSLPFRDGSFGIVAACSVLHHLPDPVRAVAEMCRVAAAHSIIWIPHEPRPNWRSPLLARLIGRVSWALWRVQHPRLLWAFVYYAVFHRRRLRDMRRGITHVEQELQPALYRSVRQEMEKHAFTVEATCSGGIVRLKGYRAALAARESQG